MEEEKSFAELLEASERKPVRLKQGQSVEAVIAKITSDWVFIDLGGKTEGIVERNEFLDKEGQLTVKEGDTVKVYVKIVEGTKERVQVFEGVVIKKTRGNSRAQFTVRKISYGVGVERTFPSHSPVIDRVQIVTRGKVRRAKLFYLRGRKGKETKIKEADKH